MNKINCGLIVSDFDGTLLSTRQTISDNVKNAINEYIAAGGIFAVCTGRMLASILPRVRSLGLKGLVVAYQGAVIADIESGKLELTDDNEDIHINIERALTDRIGDAGKRLHTARSRNDQVALDIRMNIKKEICEF